MRITLTTLGTRRDHRQPIALAAHLVDRDHEVTVAASAGGDVPPELRPARPPVAVTFHVQEPRPFTASPGSTRCT